MPFTFSPLIHFFFLYAVVKQNEGERMDKIIGLHIICPTWDKWESACTYLWKEQLMNRLSHAFKMLSTASLAPAYLRASNVYKKIFFLEAGIYGKICHFSYMMAKMSTSKCKEINQLLQGCHLPQSRGCCTRTRRTGQQRGSGKQRHWLSLESHNHSLTTV